MKQAKLAVIYPTPTNIEEFEKVYAEEHVPLAVEKLAGKTRIIGNLVTQAVGHEQSPYHRYAEIYFPDMQTLEACLSSLGGQETAAHAVKISTGGAPLFLISETTTYDF